MSRLAALKEYTFMKALKENGFLVPEAIANSRHTIVMELIDAFPLRQITEIPDPPGLYTELIEIILRLAQYGLIHGDYNEFNILIKEENETSPKPTDTENDLTSPIRLTPVLIDFPQMVSIDHANAEMYFDRDVSCIKRFFERRFHFTSDEPGPFFADAKKLVGKSGVKRLDVEVEASGFSKKMAKDLEKYMKEVGVDGDGGNGRDDEGRADDMNDSEEVEGEAETPNDALHELYNLDATKDSDDEGILPNTLEEPSEPVLGIPSSSLGNT